MGFRLRRHPFLLELNARIWCKRLSQRYRKQLSLSFIPQKEWDEFARQGFDLIWLMGIWKRSPGARGCALADANLRKHCKEIFGDFKEDYLAGSPYAVYDYTLDPLFGAPEELPRLKDRLNKTGLGLIVDFVPNHLALDHPWTISHPECFIRATAEEADRNPGLFFKTSRGIYLAHGKDPYFEPWRDTVQIDFFSAEARRQMARELLRIAEIADGVRCDMAMLGLNEVFEKNWGRFLKSSKKPQAEFWEEIISRVKAEYPRFIFLGEVYWDLEWRLQQLGFDFTYDKKLYDRLRFSQAQDIRGHLQAEPSYQEKSVRFIENHDEPRALAAFGRKKSYAAAAITATVPGMRFFHQGQQEGKKIHQAIQFSKEIPEKQDAQTEKFYKCLLEFASEEPLRSGAWKLLEATPAGERNSSFTNLLSWCWKKGSQAKLVVVNYSAYQAQGRIQFPGRWLQEGTSPLKFCDRYSGQVYARDPKGLREAGLFVDLGPWKAHLFELT